jgi:competence protein ComEC
VLAIVVAWDPWSVLSAGFWLSFVAVAVLLGVVSQPRQVAATWLSRMGTELVSVWRVQWRLSVVLAPLTWLLFGQVSVVGVAVNLLAIPLVSFVVLPLGMLGLLFSIAWSAVVPVVHHLFVALEWAQQLPWAVIQPPALPMWLAVVVCTVVFTLAQP